MIPNNIRPYIPVGANKRQQFESQVDDFFNDWDFHIWLRGQPGVGKTRYVNLAAKKAGVLLVPIEGMTSRWLFLKKLAVYLHQAGWPDPNNMPKNFNPKKLPKVCVFFDDCSTVFKEDFIDTLKIGLEEQESDKITYNTSLGGQYAQSEPHEKVAIDHFKNKVDPGFQMNFYGRVKFIFTMNHSLADEHDLAEYRKRHGVKASKTVVKTLEEQAALSTRLQYKDLHMSKDEYWGWIADVVLNGGACAGATKKDKEEMLVWLYDNWGSLREHSVRFVVQKMWKDLNKAKTKKGYDYKSRWMNSIKLTA